MKRLPALMALLAVLALAVPSVGMAASSTCQAYNPQTCQPVNNVTTTTSTSAGTLPFTGLDVALLVGGGATLLGAGLVVRRLSRRLN